MMMMMPQWKVHFLKLYILKDENNFCLENKPAPYLPTSKNFRYFGTKITFSSNADTKIFSSFFQGIITVERWLKTFSEDINKMLLLKVIVYHFTLYKSATSDYHTPNIV